MSKLHAIVMSLCLVACGKSEAPSASPTPPPPEAAKLGADTPEKAVALYHEGMQGDFDKMWAVAPAEMKKQGEAMVANLAKASPEELAGMGITPAQAKELDIKGFFELHLSKRSDETKQREARPVTELKVEPAANDKTKASYKMGPAHCEAELVKEPDGWKVEGHSCEEGG